MKLKRYVKRIKHYIYYILAIIAGRIILILPRKIALSLGKILGDILFLTSRKERRQALDNLHKAFGNEKSLDDILAICRNCFRNLGKGLMEFLQFSKLNSDNLDKLVIIEGRQNTDGALKRGKGVIILTAHFGNWELAGASFPLSGYSLSTIVRPAKLEYLDKWINSYRESTGLRCIGRGASIKSALQCLKRNELLGILADVDTKVDGVFVDFFGRLAYTPTGPVIIALRTGAPLIPVFIIRQKNDTHKLIIEKPLELKITGNTEEDIKINTTAYTKIIESYIREYPEQWIWFHKRWRNKI